MSQDDGTIKINDVEYVRKDSLIRSMEAEKLDGLKYVIVRTYSAGVFAGYLKSREGAEVVLINARRLYQWAGAATLSQIAMEGTKNPKGCKFPMEVARIELLGVIEIADATEVSRKSIASVDIWKC